MPSNAPTIPPIRFNTQPPEGGCLVFYLVSSYLMVSTHSRLKAAVSRESMGKCRADVSTHSRLKAAEIRACRCKAMASFNTQPPEGGWDFRRLFALFGIVSTHSRLKAAANC